VNSSSPAQSVPPTLAKPAVRARRSKGPEWCKHAIEGKSELECVNSHKIRQSPVNYLAHADVGPSCIVLRGSNQRESPRVEQQKTPGVRSRLERTRTGPTARTQTTWFAMVLGVGREWATNSARDDLEARLCRAWVTGSLPCPAVARTHTHAATRTAHSGSLRANSPPQSGMRTCTPLGRPAHPRPTCALIFCPQKLPTGRGSASENTQGCHWYEYDKTDTVRCWPSDEKFVTSADMAGGIAPHCLCRFIRFLSPAHPAVLRLCARGARGALANRFVQILGPRVT
jgi:hypothetical protein